MHQVDALAVARPLSLTERAVVLALAVSLDNDYFSQHSGHGYTLVFHVHVLVELSKFMRARYILFLRNETFEYLDY